MNNLEKTKSAFMANYYRAVNSCLTNTEEQLLRNEFRELEDSLMSIMPEDEFLVFYDLVHKMAWDQSA